MRAGKCIKWVIAASLALTLISCGSSSEANDGQVIDSASDGDFILDNWDEEDEKAYGSDAKPPAVSVTIDIPEGWKPLGKPEFGSLSLVPDSEMRTSDQFSDYSRDSGAEDLNLVVVELYENCNESPEWTWVDEVYVENDPSDEYYNPDLPRTYSGKVAWKPSSKAPCIGAHITATTERSKEDTPAVQLLEQIARGNIVTGAKFVS